MQISKLILALVLVFFASAQDCYDRCNSRPIRFWCYNGVTYPSLCIIRRCLGVTDDELYTRGRCPTQNCECRDDYEPVCGVNGVTYNSRCEADCVGATINTNIAGPCECNCLPVRQPVCGNNQVTYLNACVAGCYNIGVLYLRPCDEFPRIQPYPRVVVANTRVNEIQRPFRFIEDPNA